MIGDELMQASPVEQGVEQQVSEEVQQAEPTQWDGDKIDSALDESVKQLKVKETSQPAPQVEAPVAPAVPPAQAPAAVEKIEPEKFWKPEEKAFFNTLPPQQQKLFMDMFRNPAKAYDKAVIHMKQEYEPKAKLWQQHEPLLNEYKPQEFNRILAPLQERLKQSGISSGQYVQAIVEESVKSQDDPIGFIHDFIQNYMQRSGSTLNDIMSRIQERDLAKDDPAYIAAQNLRREVDELKKFKYMYDNERQQKESEQTAQNTEYEQRENQQKSMDIINDFRQTKDEHGNLKYPLFDEVSERMAEFSEHHYKEGEEVDLEYLYNTVVYSNPETRAKMLEIERQTAAQQSQEATRLTKAKKAVGMNVKSSPSDVVLAQDAPVWSEASIDNLMDRHMAAHRDD